MDRAHTSNPGGDRDHFQAITVGKCYAQTANDRFGPGATEAIRERERLGTGLPLVGNEAPYDWPTVNGNEDDHVGRADSIFRLVPSMQTNRNNLTALSSVHNLYFVAYQNRVFVYRPRDGVRCKLAARPDLQITVQMSLQARMVGGYIDRPGKGQTINHLITGFLGGQEIVLLCTDNGDVVAYDTSTIAACVFGDALSYPGLIDLSEKRGKGQVKRCKRPRPFFHENVCKTAWGLAIHTQSKLIAVSSNLAEVTVFAFSQTGDADREHNFTTEGKVRERFRTWRIIISLGPNAENIPNVCFLDDERGFAEKIAAIDIEGVAWIAHIWKPKSPVAAISRPADERLVSEEFFPDMSRGWGILAFRDIHFMKVHSVEELIGISWKKSNFRADKSQANLHRSLKLIPDNPCIEPGQEVDHDPTWNPPMTILALIDNDIGIADIVDDEDDDQYDDDSDEDDEDLSDSSESSGEDGMGNSMSPMDQEGEIVQATLEPGSEITLPSIETDMTNNLPSFIPLPVAQTYQPGPPFASHALMTLQPTDWANTLSSTFQGAFEQLGAALGELEDAVQSFDFQQPSMHKRHSKSGTASKEQSSSWYMEGYAASFIYRPHNASTVEAPYNDLKRSQLVRAREANCISSPAEPPDQGVAPGYVLLRTYEKDFEMFPLATEDEDSYQEARILCTDAITFERSSLPVLQRSFRATSRLSMLAHIPELSMVILGSPTGRIMLITLTRMAKPLRVPGEESMWDHGMRVEWILPKRSDEEIHRRSATARPLYGMAVGRVPSEEGDSEDGPNAIFPKRYRIMLHYHNHLILSYEVTRDEQTQKLCVF